jgi:hypothetical protein
MANFKALKESLAKNGEVMIRLDTSETIELHIHNATFDDNTQEIIVDASNKTYWIEAEHISYYWIHKEDLAKE